VPDQLKARGDKWALNKFRVTAGFGGAPRYVKWQKSGGFLTSRGTSALLVREHYIDRPSGVIDFHLGQQADHLGAVSCSCSYVESARESGFEQPLIHCHACVLRRDAHLALLTRPLNVRNGVVSRTAGFFRQSTIAHDRRSRLTEAHASQILPLQGRWHGVAMTEGQRDCALGRAGRPHASPPPPAARAVPLPQRAGGGFKATKKAPDFTSGAPFCPVTRRAYAFSRLLSAGGRGS